MNKYLYFGEKVEGYEVPILNEREARAAAGILFLLGIVSFLNALLLHDFRFTQVFVTLFMVDFIIRVLINPKFSPSLLLGRVFVQNQTPEYVGAAQKRFAWSIGLALSVPMFVVIVILEYMTPIKIIVCIICLALLFSEAAFGICLGCKIFHLIYGKPAQHCPGNVCEIKQKDEIQKISKVQWLIVVVSFSLVTLATIQQLSTPLPTDSNNKSIMKCQAGKCGM